MSMRRRKRDGADAAENDDAHDKEADADSDAGDAHVAGPTVVIGTYDGALLGFSLDTGAQTFGYAPHAGCVKALHCSKTGRLASGGTDHSVRLFDLSRAVELGELQEHDDSVSCVQFWGPGTLVTGGADGKVCVWRCSDWELLLKFRAHKAAVVCLAVHPSGRSMASAGRDSGLRLWDMTRGTSAASLTTEGAIEVLEWSPQGNFISCLSPRELLIVDARTGATASYRDPSSSGFMRVTLSAAAFLSDSEVLLGDGKGDLRALTFTEGKSTLVEACKLPAEGMRARIKALICVPRGAAGGACGLVVVGLSSGAVEVWHTIGPVGSATFSRVRSVDTGVRLTCLAVWLGPGEQSKDKESKANAAAVTAVTAVTAGAAAGAGGHMKRRKKAKTA